MCSCGHKMTDHRVAGPCTVELFFYMEPEMCSCEKFKEASNESKLG